MKQPIFLAEDFVFNFDYRQNKQENRKIIDVLKKIISKSNKYIFNPYFELYLPTYENYIQPDLLNKKFDYLPSNGSIEFTNPYNKKNTILLTFIHYSDPLFKEISLPLKLFSKLQDRNGFFVFYFEKLPNNEWIIPLKHISIEDGEEIFPIKVFQQGRDIQENINEITHYSIFNIFKNLSYFFNEQQEYFFTHSKFEYQINVLLFKKINQDIFHNQEIVSEIKRKYQSIENNLKKTYNRSVLKYKEN